ncbi:MAG: sce7725 family protein [Salibacter sp.]|uniref:sce7725 family protein n=1 Tax=Salibacter sp. TaxID=2010995 RepID=UPI0028709973|nr:sce7725 family protein [Salibacter sp.]MDR9399741.1 sce7725 family protein [Salibacter sp.]
MYFPYLRGKQFELISLRELSEQMSETGVIHPVIEPVKETTSTLRISCEHLVDVEMPFTLVINPSVGDLKSSQIEIIDFINTEIGNYEQLHLGILVHSNSDLTGLEISLSSLENQYPFTLIHLNRYPDMDSLSDFYREKDVRFNLFRDPNLVRRYRRVIDQSTKVILSDPFNSKPTNADYAEVSDEFFTDEHNYYQGDGYVGFSDYLTIGEDYSDSGFAPYAVTIHLTYLRDDGQIWIRHFVSDSNEDYTDVPGTYKEALDKLIEFINNEGLQSSACDEFRRQAETGHYPGLGSVKKLSIIHHIELIMGILSQE